MNILVTGATGFIGSEVLARLLKSGTSPESIFVLSRKAPHDSALLKLRLKEHGLNDPSMLNRLAWAPASLEQPDTLKRCLQELPKTAAKWRVLHLAALISAGHSADSKNLPVEEQRKMQREVNIKATTALVDWANLYAELFVFTSSVVAFGGSFEREIRSEKDFPNFPEECRKIGYFSTKREAHEGLLQLSKIPVKIYCPGIVHGSYEGFKSSRGHLKLLREGKLKWAPPGGGNFVGLDRVSRALADAVTGSIDFQGAQTRLLVDQNLKYVDYFKLYVRLFNGLQNPPIKEVTPRVFARVIRALRMIPFKIKKVAQISENLEQTQYYLWFKSEFSQPETQGLEHALKASFNTMS